jgi:pantetheine-phosphate adenylyltransferase
VARTRTGLYPGTFDPITFGHLDIIRRAAALVDVLVVGVAVQSSKTPIFTLEERCRLVREVTAGVKGAEIRVEGFDGLVVDYAGKIEANVIVRGLRGVLDFDYEFQMAGMNARLKPGIETVFLMADAEHHAISASLVRQIARLKGEVGAFVPPVVAAALARRVTEED